MLMLVFYVGNDRYALDSAQVVEVIPRVRLRKVYHVPTYVAGLFNYRGAIVPVIDLGYLIQDSPCSSLFSTRIIMVNYQGKNEMRCLMGLMAQRVTETLNQSDTELATTGFNLQQAPYLGEMMIDEQGMIQRIRLDYLFSDYHQSHLLPLLES